MPGFVYIHCMTPRGAAGPDGIPVDHLTGVTLTETDMMPRASLDLIRDAGMDGDGARIMVRLPEDHAPGGAVKLQLAIRRHPGIGWTIDVVDMPDQGDGPPRMDRQSNFRWLLSRPGGEA